MSPDEWASCHEVQVIKGQSGKWGQCAGKVNALIWGDLALRRGSGNRHREMPLKGQKSAEAIVPGHHGSTGKG